MQDYEYKYYFIYCFGGIIFVFWLTGGSFLCKTGISILVLYARNRLSVIYYFKAGEAVPVSAY